MIAYLIKSSLCLLVLGFFYKLFLEKEKIHNLKRYYLIFSIVFAYTIPLITLTYEKIVYIAPEELVIPTEEIIVTGHTSFVHKVPEEPIDYSAIILWGLYSIGVVVFGFRFSRNLYNLGQKVRSNEKLKEPSHTNVLLGDSVIPHTFLKYIFVSKAAFLQKEIPEEVLFHERAHVRQKHTLDILFVEVLQIVFWFNPLLFWIKKSIKLNHEFLADQTVLKNQYSIQHYIKLLVSYPSSPDHTALTSTINYSLTKKRLQMMTREFSKKKITLKLIALLPVLLICVFCFNNEIVAQEKNNWVYSKTKATTDPGKKIKVSVDGKNIDVNGTSTELENLGKTIDEVTKQFKDEELTEFNFSIQLSNVADSYIDEINEAYRSTRLYKSHADNHELIPPPPPAPVYPIVKKGEMSNIPAPPAPADPMVKKGEEYDIPIPPPPPPVKAPKVEMSKKEIPTPPSPITGLSQVTSPPSPVKPTDEEAIDITRTMAEERAARVMRQAEEVRLQAEKRMNVAQQTSENAREKAMLLAEEARLKADMVRKEAEMLARIAMKDAQVKRVEAMEYAQSAQRIAMEAMKKDRAQAQIARREAMKDASIAREEALLAAKLEREQMKMERRNMSLEDKREYEKEMKKLENETRKEIEKARKKHIETGRKLREIQRKAQEKKLKTLKKLEEDQK